MVLLLATLVGVAIYATSASLIAFDRQERADAYGLALAWIDRLVAHSRAWRLRLAQ
jgi:hypothetical protein